MGGNLFPTSSATMFEQIQPLNFKLENWAANLPPRNQAICCSLVNSSNVGSEIQFQPFDLAMYKSKYNFKHGFQNHKLFSTNMRAMRSSKAKAFSTLANVWNLNTVCARRVNVERRNAMWNARNCNPSNKALKNCSNPETLPVNLRQLRNVPSRRTRKEQTQRWQPASVQHERNLRRPKGAVLRA